MAELTSTQLLRAVIEASDRFEAYLADELDLNPTDLDAMGHLMRNGPLGPTDLARRLGISAPAATAVVDRLSAVGHVQRQKHPTDRRAVVVAPNPASVQMARKALDPMINALDETLLGFNEHDRGVIHRYLLAVLMEFEQRFPAR